MFQGQQYGLRKCFLKIVSNNNNSYGILTLQSAKLHRAFSHLPLTLQEHYLAGIKIAQKRSVLLKLGN